MRITYFLLIAILFVFAIRCSSDQQEAGQSSSGDVSFEEISPEKSGIDFFGRINEDASRNYFLFNYIYIGGGVASADFNQDGLEDIYFISNTDSSKLYINKGDFKFEQLPASSGVALPNLLKTGVTIVDINQDGYPDIYQCVTGELEADRKNRLLINNGDLTFREAAQEYGLALENPSTSAAFFDYDRDGDLDVYVINRPIDYNENDKVRLEEINGKPQRLSKPRDEFESDVLLENTNGRYVSANEKAGIANRGFSLSLVVADVNNDNWPDVYVANDYIEPDLLYINQRDGTFQDEASTWFAHMPHFSMGADIADLDGDGLSEIMTLDMLPDDHYRQITNTSVMNYRRYATLLNYGYGKQIMRNMLQANNGNGSFSEVACLADVYKTDWSWGPLLCDVNNDGKRDIFISNGFLRDVGDLDFNQFTTDSLKQSGLTADKLVSGLDLMPSQKLSNYLYINEGEYRFSNSTTAAGLDKPTFSNGSVYADFDNDGKLDLAVHNNEDFAGIYRNTSKPNHYISIALKGKPGNVDAYGAKVKIQLKQGIQVAELQPTRGFLSSQSKLIHFGLGEESVIETLEIFWPDGTISTQKNVSADQRIVIQQANASQVASTNTSKENDLLFSTPITLPFVHQENTFSHFEEAPLLYRDFSAEGPVAAVGDINGDGLDDIYHGASIGFSGSLLIQTTTEWKPNNTAFKADEIHEDGVALFFDADGDKDLDLFVGSTGVAQHGDPKSLADRLYINAGGVLAKAENALPAIGLHTSAAVAVDVDADGDLDLVIGHHSNLNNFPLQEPNQVLINEGGKFSFTQSEVINGWANLGMVNAIKAADLDGDGVEEIVAAGEWMPITVFKKQGDSYKNATEAFGLSGLSGLWLSLETLDIDGDGDQDLVAGNIGLNTRFEASMEAPIILAGYDIDGNQQVDPLIFGKKGTDRYWPYARREELIKQVPAFAKTYPRFAAYGKAGMDDFLGSRNREELKKAGILASVVLLNEQGKFELDEYKIQLPRSAQHSPLRGLAHADINGDGISDLIGVGNMYRVEMHGGSLDAGKGSVLTYVNGELKALPNVESGFYAQGDTRQVHVVRTTSGLALLVTRNDDAPLLFALRQ